MRRLRALLARTAGLFGRGRSERELDEELAAHVEMHVADNVRAGMSPAEARRVALLKLGGIEQAKELYRERRGLPVVEMVVQDATLALRMMRRNPGLTGIALVVLALGIGANTVMFSVVNALLLRPLPYPEAERLQLVQTVDASGSEFGTAPPDFYAYRSGSGAFESFSSFYSRPLDLTGAGDPEQVRALIVSSDFLATLRTPPGAGRGFLPSDESWGGHRVAVLADALWRRRFAADPGILGRQVVLGAEPYVVVGILPPRFSFVGMEADVLVPMAFAPGDNMNSRNNYFLTMVGRLHPGVTGEGAAADLNRLADRIVAEHPENRGTRMRVQSLQASVVAGVRPAVLVLFGAVVFVLLIACADLANLLMARAAVRRREIALRIAIGASRRRVLGQLLTESVVLSLCGSALALALAWVSMGILNSLGQDMLPRTEDIRIDAAVLGYTALLAVATAVLFGLAPAWRSVDVDPGEALQESAHTGDTRGHHVRAGLVVLEIAMSLVLLIGAGLMVKSMHGLTRVEAGFDAGSVMTAQVDIPRRRYVDEALERRFSPLAYGRATRFYSEAVDRVRGLPGVTAAGAINGLPLTGNVWGKNVVLHDRPLPPAIRDLPVVEYRIVVGDYFRALGVPILAGRAFTDADTEDAAKVAIVSREMARRHWKDQDPIGKVISVNPPVSLLPPGMDIPPEYEPRLFTVVGVSEDVRYAALATPPAPVVYVPFAQGSEGETTMYVAVRAEGDPAALGPGIRERVRQVDPDVPVSGLLTMEDRVTASLAQPRLQVMVLGAFAGLALLLAAVGIYGVMAYATRQRTREIGIRMAIGAGSRAILRLLLARGLAMVGGGIAAGLLGAFVLTRALRTLLFQVSPSDPVVFAAVTAALAAVGMLAAWLPARRATRMAPVAALREE